jgi:hypothetical protein
MLLEGDNRIISGVEMDSTIVKTAADEKIERLEREVGELRQWKQRYERVVERMERLPETSILSPNLAGRAVAIYGHFLLAQAIIAGILFVLIFLFSILGAL